MPHHCGPRLVDQHALPKAACISLGANAESLQCSVSLHTEENSRRIILGKFCAKLARDASYNPREHFRTLNEQLYTLLAIDNKSCFNAETGDCVQNERIIHDVKAVLCRFPDVPPRLLAFPYAGAGPDWSSTLWDWTVSDRWRREYLVPEAHKQLLTFHTLPKAPLSTAKKKDHADQAWRNFYVTTCIDDVSLLFLTLMTRTSFELDLESCSAIKDYCDTLAETLDVLEELCMGNANDGIDFSADEKRLLCMLGRDADVFRDESFGQGIFITKAFLWCAWQRSISVLNFQIVRREVHGHFTREWATLLSNRGIRRLDYVDIAHVVRKSTPYLCGWALQLLRRTRTALSLDFRHLIYRFNEQFPDRKGRCFLGFDSSCGGGNYKSCTRFDGMEAHVGSAHDPSCRAGCRVIDWDKGSYVSAKHPRAVSTYKSDTHLRYCTATNQTMAISHVWQHGQGGSPESGLNRCLHSHYCRLARKFGCSSYWIDSTCIPGDPELRREAIKGINTVFGTSRVVVVSDRDLKEVDVKGHSIDKLERALSTLLLSDWNVRAWTLLEASRAKKTITLLCKDEDTVPLGELCRRIFEEGQISLATLLGCTEHLLPMEDPAANKTLAHAGYLLNQRFASRAGDDCRIWCLLSNLDPKSNAEDIWCSVEGINTGFLMSSAPRIARSGLHWAPTTPWINRQVRTVQVMQRRHPAYRDEERCQRFQVRYNPLDASGSFVGTITTAGLRSRWLFRDIDLETVAEHMEKYVGLMSCSSRKDCREVKEYQMLNENPRDDDDIYIPADAALACQRMEALLNSNKDLRLVRPLREDGETPYEHGTNRGDRRGPVAALCIKDEREDARLDETWRWDRVYQWREPTAWEFWQVGEMMMT